MADDADYAQLYQDQLINNAIKNALAKAQHKQSAICKNCREPISIGSFCDADCRYDFEMRNRNQ